MPAKNATQAEKRRFEIISRHVGCICCRIEFARYIEAEVNHLLNGYRIGHGASIPECVWHHRGECLHGIDSRAMRRTFGPSRKLHKKSFRKRYGSDSSLLALTNTYVAKFEANIIGGGTP